ncbi:peptidylprolyl isomerase [Oceanibaculum pacificum]|uniref:Parvulin-like PPIase n=1 Tax=Oceanibaculum pacificum TaxID=580166 RepID=A0A154WER6_9PROT|nr:peptidylprolyl isomerase [Oceanibaculum pacificum]KZD12000.1 hypothetical protein AUP43_17780 [Oceanibaculum pacificum]
MLVLRLSALFAAALAVTWLGAQPASAQTSVQPIPDAAAAVDPDTVVATVDGAAVRQSDVLSLIETLPAQYRQIPMEMLYPALLERAIDGALLQKAGEARNLADDPAVQRRIEAYRNRVIQEEYLTKVIDEKVTDAAIEERYKKLRAETPKAEEVRASHILVESEEEAKAIVKQLDGGADFAAIAREKSIDPGKDNGGDLGFFTADQMVPEFAEAAFAMQPGKHSAKPVKSQFGWHVIKLVERREQPAPSLDQMRAQISNELAEEAARTQLEQLREKATIERFTMTGEPQPAAPQPQPQPK